VRQLFDVGQAAQIEVLRVEAAIASAQAERLGVASSLDRAERNLARWTGAPVEETRADRLAAVSIVESPVPPREDLRELARAGSPAVRAARQGLEAAEAAVVGARSARFPDVRRRRKLHRLWQREWAESTRVECRRSSDVLTGMLGACHPDRALYRRRTSHPVKPLSLSDRLRFAVTSQNPGPREGSGTSARSSRAV
jgi:hypothetical protein